jgi:hypothetical protein
VTVLRNPDQLGTSRSFTRAIDAATADIVLISGGDDISLAGRGASQVAALEDPAVTLVSSLPVIIDAFGRLLPGDVASGFVAKPPAVGALEYLYFGANYICAPSAAFRRSDYLRFGGFPPNNDNLQDHALWLELAAAGEVVVAETPVVGYRKHSANTSRVGVGLDAPRGRRLVAERDWLLDAFLVRAKPEVRTRLAASRGIPAERFAALDALEQIALLQLNHPDSLVVRRGLARLFEIGARDDGNQRLAAMGLEPSDFEGFAIAADHENATGVGRALGIGSPSASPADDR